MTFIPTPSAALIVIRHTLFNKAVDNNLWFTGPGNFGQADLADLIDALDSWYQANFLLFLSADLTYIGMKGYDMSSSNGPTWELVTSQAGGATGSSLPGKDCVVSSFGTGGRGRSSRGRIYSSGVREADCAGNTIDATLRGNLGDAWSALSGAVESPTQTQHVVVSFQQDGTPLSAGNPRIVTSYTMRPGVKSQRGRS